MSMLYIDCCIKRIMTTGCINEIIIKYIFQPLETNLKKQLVKIHNGVRMFQRQLTDVKPTPECK